MELRLPYFYRKTLRLVKQTGHFLRRGVYLTIVLTDRCTLKCKYCPMFIGREKQVIREECTLDEWKKFIEVFPHWIAQINISGGEPSLVSYMPELVNWLVDRGHHVTVYTNLAKPEVLARMKKSFKLQVQATYHHKDSSSRFAEAYMKLKSKFRILPLEIVPEGRLRVFQFTKEKPFFTEQHILDFTSLHTPPDGARTLQVGIGCEPIYAGMEKENNLAKKSISKEERRKHPRLRRLKR